MLHKEFWGLLFLAFVGWMLIATTPTKRIENACAPVGWGGNVVTSLSALVLPNQQATLQGWFDKLEYGCQYTTWRLFYQEEYNAWLKTTKQGAAAKAEPKAAAAPRTEPDAEPAEPPASAPGDMSKPPAPLSQ